MAIAEPPSEVATCPLCHNYEGEPSSVEGHISSSTDPIHKGEVGRAHRADLRRQVVGTGDVDASDDRPKTATEVGPSDDPSTGGGHPSGDRDTTDEDAQEDDEMTTNEELDRQRSQLVEDGDDQETADGQLDGDDDRDDRADEPEDEPAGIPIPVSTGTLVVGLVALFAVYWLVIRDSESDSEDEQQGQQDGQTTPDGFGGGLVEGI